MTLTRHEIEKSLKVVSKAWGRTQDGWCYFPYIDREAQKKTGLRRTGFHETPPFHWPQDREKIIDYLYSHQQYDVYWCPSLFEFKDQGRRVENAMDEHALWADLDEVNPESLTDYPPSVAWETSPGRYQCLWLMNNGDIQGASWAGNENQRMTYLIGADPSGWDTTQLLRLPFWPNHKPDYKSVSGECPKGSLLWTDGPTYQPDDFGELPEVQGYISSNLADALESQIDGVDRYKVIARVKLKLTKKARELLAAKSSSGDLSSNLWYLERCLADVGCSIAEIVAVVRPTVWNKFGSRPDELHTLINEASKAIAKVKKAEDIEEFDDEGQKPSGDSLFGDILKNAKPPNFIIKNLITEGACGFIAGEPKSFKSWCGLDLAISVATGNKFLNYFEVIDAGPVIYIQEEDPLPTLKTRTIKIWDSKNTGMVKEADGVYWEPNKPFNPNINAYVQKSFTISEEDWMIWLDELLAAKMKTVSGEILPYKMILIDTLMMTAGNVEENKSHEMTQKVFRPLKVLARKHNVAVYLIHHMGKADQARSGKRLLGSVANHAWAEDSLYLSQDGYKIKMELESKTVPSHVYSINNIVGQKYWAPEVDDWNNSIYRPINKNELYWPLNIDKAPTPGARTLWNTYNLTVDKVKTFLLANGPSTLQELCVLLATKEQSTKARMKRLKTKGFVSLTANRYAWIGPTA